MIPYLFLLLYILIICSLKLKNKRVSLLLCFIPFFVFMATQEGWTSDFEDYEKYYEEAQNYWQLSYFALKYEFLYAWVEHIMPTYRMLIVTQMLLYTIALYILFYYHIPQKYWIISFLLFFLDNNMLLMTVSAIRSCFVASLFIIAYHLKSKDYRIIPIILVILSVFFHKSAVLLIPFILIPKHVNTTVFKLIIGIAVIVVLLVFITPGSFNNLLNSFLNDSEELSGYTTYTNAISHTIGNLITQLLSTACVFYLIYIASNNRRTNPIYDDFVFISTIFILTLRIIPDMGMTTRFVNYFGPIMLVCNAKVLQMDKNKWSYLYVGYTLLFAIYYLVRFVPAMGAWEAIRNYNSILF